MKDRCLVVLANGKKYIKQLSVVQKRFKQYADYCNADFECLTQLPPEFINNTNRDAFSWKLLIPYIYRKYKTVLFLDLDIFISPVCPDLFNMIPENIGLMAYANDRNSAAYKRLYSSHSRVISETVEEYFTNNGFSYTSDCIGDINGGVLLFRPALIADMFKNFWISSRQTSKLYCGDEPALAYLAQSNKLFLKLPQEFNYEVMYALCSEENIKYYKLWKFPFIKAADKLVQKAFKINNLFLNSSLKKMLSQMIDNRKTYIIHFSGGFWNESLYKKLMKEHKQ